MSHQRFANPILYQNAERSIFLIDIPRSIAAAQGTQECPVADSILSGPPLEVPYEIKNEPKNPEAVKKMQGQTFDVEMHEQYKLHIQAALAEIRSNVRDEWCLPRKLSNRAISRASTVDPDVTMSAETNHHETSNYSLHLKPPGPVVRQHEGEPVDNLLSTLCAFTSRQRTGSPPTMELTVPHRGSSRSSASVEPEEPWDTPLYNAKRIPMVLTVRDHAKDGVSSASEFRFKIPPLSKIMLEDSTHPQTLRESVRALGQEHDLRRDFDFILIDPPWPNASAKRKNTYSVEPSLKTVKQMLLKMDLDTIITENGIIAVWITNKAAIRRLVLGEGGLFQSLNIALKEEWIWVKTTTAGELMSDMDSVLKKPYETLLLGQALGDLSNAFQDTVPIKRRVIVAVPDHHSRKPCVKSIIEQLLPKPSDYTALEVFARHLVSDWWSWGNEVLKYNWEGHWAVSSSIA